MAMETVCLLGRNGAGKTTTMRAIVGTVPLAAGCLRASRRESRPENVFGKDNGKMSANPRPEIIVDGVGSKPISIARAFVLLANEIIASFGSMFAILRALGMFVADMFKSGRQLEAENLFLRHQLTIAGAASSSTARQWTARCSPG
jgi:ABC-type Na+ transport system ATPase subunit NatA